MIVFNSDIDNTLIYSYKHDIGIPKQCVEVYQGREISYMTEVSYEYLKKVRERYLFVPTTTRSIEQYRRIDFGIKEPEYALVCNGGILLENGNIDQGWYEDSLNLVADSRAELDLAIHILKKDPYISFEIRSLNELFVFTKSENVNTTTDCLKAVLDLEQVDVFSNGSKVYVVPRVLNKGDAILRLQERLKADKLIAAGDSEFDVPMLRVADEAYAPDELRYCFAAGEDSRVTFLPTGKEFTEQLLWKLLERGR